MKMTNNVLDWLNEAEEPPVPTTQPDYAQGINRPDAISTGSVDTSEQDDDVENDPIHPDTQEEKQNKDFEQWKYDFCKLSIKGDVEEMIDYAGQIRMRPGLELAQKKFIEDNLQILMFRREPNIQIVNKEIRNLINQDLDRVNPGTTLMQHITNVVQKYVGLQEYLIKMAGTYSQKGDIHRKFITAILGGVMVGNGYKNPDIMLFARDYTIKISTRYTTQFGEINLGQWSLKTDDPSRYLSEPELERLKNGSPDERQSLRRRIILQSIAEKFKERAFLIHVANNDGTIFNLGWDLGDCLLAAYKNGKIIVRGLKNTEKEAMISDTGDIIQLIDYDIRFVKETGETDEDGKPEMEEVPFIQRKDSVLYLVADLDTVKMAGSTLSGLFYNELPYNGNPAEVITLMQCVPSLTEILNRQCGPQG